MPLMKLCDKIQDGSHFSPQVQYPEKRNDTYMYVTAKNIRKKGMDLKNLTYVDKSFFESIYSRCDPKKGDLLLTKDGVNTGDCAINELDDPFALLSSVAIIRGKEGVLDNKFVKYYIDSPRGFNKITGKMTGTAIKRIILRRIKEAEIPYLQINEQKRIVNEIEAKFSIIDILEGNIQKCLIKARLLRMSLLKSAFDGKLVGGLNDRS
jgi:type I restriction enzyme S subunit